MVEVEGSSKDLHSGVFGGPVFEPMIDLTRLLATLVDRSVAVYFPCTS